MNLLRPESNNLGAALEYADRGWSVFPCHYMSSGRCSCGNGDCKSPGKHPKIAGGFKSSSTIPEQITGWWGKEPNANIGIATGPASGAWVLDLDGAEGIANLEELVAENGQIPLTPSVATGGGGRHLFFAVPSDREVKNRTKIGGLSIDVRGDGGYVIAPPSNHRSGSSYRWEVSPEDVPLAEAPSWLLDLVTDRGPRPVSSTDDEFDEMTDGNDLRSARGVSQGSRHNTALRLIGSALARGRDPLVVAKEALDWNDRCDPPEERDEILNIVTYCATKDLKKFEEVSTASEIAWPMSMLCAGYSPGAPHTARGATVRSCASSATRQP